MSLPRQRNDFTVKYRPQVKIWTIYSICSCTVNRERKTPDTLPVSPSVLRHRGAADTGMARGRRNASNLPVTAPQVPRGTKTHPKPSLGLREVSSGGRGSGGVGMGDPPRTGRSFPRIVSPPRGAEVSQTPRFFTRDVQPKSRRRARGAEAGAPDAPGRCRPTGGCRGTPGSTRCASRRVPGLQTHPKKPLRESGSRAADPPRGPQRPHGGRAVPGRTRREP